MSKRTLRPRIDVCQLCDFILTRKTTPRTPIRASRPTHFKRMFTTRHSNLQQPQRPATLVGVNTRSSIPPGSKDPETPLVTHAILGELEQSFERVKIECRTILEDSGKIQPEEDIERILAQYAKMSHLIGVALAPKPREKKSVKDRAASALLDLDDSAEVSMPFSRPSPTILRIQDELSGLVYSIITHPTVFITPKALELYVRIQANLKHPETIAAVFHLYANKPVPKEGSSPIKYSTQNPNKASNAIPKPVADEALQVAIDKKDLVAAMDLVEFSYATQSYRRAKFIKTGLLPATGLAVAPIAAYTLASQLAHWQTAMETEMATNVAFAGIIAYVGFTATIGVVAVTTANDQMDRVTWTPGLPLRMRWIREDERAAVDKVAGAWGFREVWRRGEEEGEEWDALREWIGLKGMIIDRTELMEGME